MFSIDHSSIVCIFISHLLQQLEYFCKTVLPECWHADPNVRGSSVALRNEVVKLAMGILSHSSASGTISPQLHSAPMSTSSLQPLLSLSPCSSTPGPFDQSVFPPPTRASPPPPPHTTSDES